MYHIFGKGQHPQAASLGMGGNQQTELRIGITFPFPFDQGLEGQLAATNEPVRWHLGTDVAGYSPSAIGVNREGRFVLASLDDVRITDERAKPRQ